MTRPPARLPAAVAIIIYAGAQRRITEYFPDSSGGCKQCVVVGRAGFGFLKDVTGTSPAVDWRS